MPWSDHQHAERRRQGSGRDVQVDQSDAGSAAIPRSEVKEAVTSAIGSPATSRVAGLELLARVDEAMRQYPVRQPKKGIKRLTIEYIEPAMPANDARLQSGGNVVGTVDPPNPANTSFTLDTLAPRKVTKVSLPGGSP